MLKFSKSFLVIAIILLLTLLPFTVNAVDLNLSENSSNTSSNKAVVPEAKGALDRFKFEVANELGVPLTDGYNGNLTSKQNGSVGGYMVKKMIEQQERQMSSGSQGGQY